MESVSERIKVSYLYFTSVYLIHNGFQVGQIPMYRGISFNQYLLIAQIQLLSGCIGAVGLSILTKTVCFIRVTCFYNREQITALTFIVLSCLLCILSSRHYV